MYIIVNNREFHWLEDSVVLSHSNRNPIIFTDTYHLIQFGGIESDTISTERETTEYESLFCLEENCHIKIMMEILYGPNIRETQWNLYLFYFPLIATVVIKFSLFSIE